MKRITILFLFALIAQIGFSQDTAWKKVYRSTSTVVNSLVHTKLDVRFDFKKAYLYGKAWVTLKPHFYSTDSLTLDAKGMDIHEVSIVKGVVKKKLTYTYDSLELRILLDKKYTRKEQYTVYISYTSKPNELKTKGSAAITNAKGLYFINPNGEEKDKPTQVWTQGETEANSAWMPTIDKPNQKSTQELSMTVPAKYVTLSNGLLISKKANTDGTRTDTWKMDLPHAPYLFFMGVGDYSIVKDLYKGKEVSYYVEKKYAPYARGIFGNTPEMMKFFSEKLEMEFPWSKYAQIVSKDYVSGAMENTTATIHQESAYQNGRQLLDGNSWEETICHELFHQWFGDLVTTESWSNLTVNESLANYSEVLWDEYKYGKDFADDHNFDDMQGYIFSGSEEKDLVRFHYADKEDMFDAVSYNKGGRILHMLRNYVGDEAFYKSLSNYLYTNKFKTGEATQLRLAFEEVTGKDMNWFWNQWYYGSGHPKLDISYEYSNNTAFVYVKQIQETNKVFKLPVAIDVYTGKNKVRHNVWIKNKIDTFSFAYSTLPDLINVDGDKILLCEKTDNKTTENFVYQYKNAPNYLDRLEALEYFNAGGLEELTLGLQDKYAGLRRYTINNLSASKLAKDEKVIGAIETIANTEKDRKTKAAAIQFLAKKGDEKYLDLFNKNVNDSSYSVSAAALEGLIKLEPNKAYTLAKKYSEDAKGNLKTAILKTYMKSGDENDFEYIYTEYDNTPPNQEKINLTGDFGVYLDKINDVSKLFKSIESIGKFRNSIPAQYHLYTDPGMKAALKKIGQTKGNDVKEAINAIFK
jgi:aminopeptidase N